MQDRDGVATGGLGFVVRLYWMLVGPVALLFLLFGIVDKRAAFPSWLDAAYWAVVASLVGARYADIRYLKGGSGDGEPATMADWRKYSVRLLGVGAGVWVVARLAGAMLR